MNDLFILSHVGITAGIGGRKSTPYKIEKNRKSVFAFPLVSSVHEDVEDEGEDLKITPKRKGLLSGNDLDKKSTDFIFPVNGRISSKFGKRGRKFHKGIDIAVNTGTPLVAIADGDVVFSGKRRGYGGTVVIDHGMHLSLYAHCSKMIARVGDSVLQGEYIARSGRTGNARGAYLHFEIRDINNRPLDPLPLLRHKTVASFKSLPKADQEKILVSMLSENEQLQ